MALLYRDLCEDIGKYTLDDAKVCKNKKGTGIYRSQHVRTQKSPSEINVVSPFYDRLKCTLKGPCFCPFHRQKRLKVINPNIIKKGLSKVNLIGTQSKKLYRKANTEQNEGTMPSETINERSADKKSTKFVRNAEKQNYTDVSHKVECRNSNFEYFLKKNELYILTGKFSGNPNRNKDDLDSDEDFLEDFCLNFQVEGDSEGLRESQYQKNSAESRGFNRKKTQKKTIYFSKRFGQDGLISKIRRLIESIIGGQKKMGLAKMQKLQKVFTNLIEQERQFEGESAAYVKNKNCLQRFKLFIDEQQAQDQNGLSSKPGWKKRNGQREKNLEGQKEIKDQKERQNMARINYNQVTDIQNLERAYSGFKNDSVSLNQWKRSNQLKKQAQKKNTSHDNGQNGLHNHEGGIDDDIFQLMKERGLKKDSFNHKKKFTNRGKNLSMMRQKSVNSKYSKDKEKENDNDYESSGNEMKKSNLYLNQNYQPYPRKNQKQAKLEEILNHMKEDTIVDKNYLKMKKYIERNKRFIRKMQMKLCDLELGVFVIEPTDSLITRKKKIRCLKEIIANQDNRGQKKGFYDQIMKYLDIYTEHCNMLMKKDARKRKEDQMYFEYQDEEFIDLLTSKDFTKSLKFITLHENEEYEKERKLQWWISIPQFVTNDETRLKKFEKLEQTLKWIQIQTKQKPIELSRVSQDWLIQTQLDHKCKVTTYKGYWKPEQKVQLSKSKLRKSESDADRIQIRFQNIAKRFGSKLL